MTNTPNEDDYEDTFPLLGAIGPYLSFTTGIMNPVEPFDEPDETVYPEETPPATWTDEDQDYWTDEEK